MEPLQQRVNERKIYEEVVNMVVNYVHKEFNDNEQARLRIYAMIAENFDGMVRAFSPPPTRKTSVTAIEYEGSDE